MNGTRTIYECPECGGSSMAQTACASERHPDRNYLRVPVPVVDARLTPTLLNETARTLFESEPQREPWERVLARTHREGPSIHHLRAERALLAAGFTEGQES